MIHRLSWISDGQCFTPGWRGALLVLAGDPDADACWEITRRIACALDAAGGYVLVCDATCSNVEPISPRAMMIGLSQLVVACELACEVDLETGDLLVLHSLDAWPDWQDAPEALATLLPAVKRGATVVLHTRVIGDGTAIFGDRQFSKLTSAVIRVDDRGRQSFVCGRELTVQAARTWTPDTEQWRLL